MKCLHCGDCCLRMSPLGSPCQRLVQEGTFYFCGDYQNRPKECADHDFPSRICPIGLGTLKLRDIEEVHRRVDIGYSKIKAIMYQEVDMFITQAAITQEGGEARDD